MDKPELAINCRCELVSGEDVSFLLGRVKTVVDSLGLPEKQEKATKDILQTVLWDWFNFITDHKTDHLRDKRLWFKNREKSN
jgi:hypothetical protein